MDDAKFMKMALSLAKKGWGFTSPNPMVGAVVVKDGKVVGKGFHKAAGKAHAEVNAIDDAKEKAVGSTIYVTLEPCNHTGRTPPCTKKILKAGIKRVVVAMKDPNPNVQGGGIEYLRNRGIEVAQGILEDEAVKLNEFFIKYVETSMPFVIAKCAATLDGNIATRTGDSKWVTGEASRAFVHWMRHGVDGIMVGAGTVKKDNPSLTTRIKNFPGKDPVRIILDSKLSISSHAKIFNLNSNAKTIIVTGEDASGEKRDLLREKGIVVIGAPIKSDGFIDLGRLMGRLGYIGITSLLIEGGSRVLASAFRAKIVDKILFFYAPKILGGNDGKPICMGKGPDLMRQSIPVGNIRLRRFEDDIMIEGYIDKSKV